jgi:hypothetical protein
MRQPRFDYTTIGSKKASGLKGLFEQWHKILAWFEKEDPTDLPYWYLERSNVGHLALAAYEISGRPLQEFSMTKGRGADKWPGRADLYISLPAVKNGSGSLDVSIEAKQRWAAIKPKKPGGLKKAVKGTLGSAMKDCGRLTDKEWDGCRRLGVAFILPYKSGRDEVSDESLADFTREIVEAARAAEAHFAAIHYAPLSLSEGLREKYGWCPGIAAVGKFL